MLSHSQLSVIAFYENVKQKTSNKFPLFAQNLK